MKFRKFTKTGFLKQIGRDLLGRFFDRFEADLAGNGVKLPSADGDEEAYFEGLARVALAPEGLPDNLIEALYGIESMANDEGQERLQRAANCAGLQLALDSQSTHADVALQLWLADPGLFAEKHNELRLTRLSAFEWLGSREPVGRREKFTRPEEDTLALMTGDMDAWFPQHNRGEQTTHIEVRQIDGEFWFMIRHGDTFARMPTAAEDRRVRVLHFRPTKDDVVVYSPERDEIRIHAGTKGERELYQATFGRRLFGDDRHFSERRAFTLEPLRDDGPDALDTDGLAGVSQIILREVECAWDNGHHEAAVRKADDVFAAAAARNAMDRVIPPGARLVRATFDFYFGDNPKPRKVGIRPPNVLKLGRHCDARRVHEWMSLRGFRGARPTDHASTASSAPPQQAEVRQDNRAVTGEPCISWGKP